MSFTESDMREAQKFLDFYVEKLEQQRHLFRYHLAEDVLLDWFGQTVKGEKKVVEFVRDTLSAVAHLMGAAAPARQIGFRESHRVTVSRPPRAMPVGLTSPPRTFVLRTQTKTPKKQAIPSTSAIGPRAADGGAARRAPRLPTSPAKKMRIGRAGRAARDSDCETVEEEHRENIDQKLRFVVSEGAVEFRKPSSKRFQTETKWRRPCKLSVAYTAAPSGGEYAVHLIIYEGNVRCRRNLMKDFEAEEPEN